jgi:isochorismate synthase
MPERLLFNPQQLTLNGKSFALWRLPHTKEVCAVVSDKTEPFTPDILKTEKQGFAFVPFDINSETPSLFLSGEKLTDIDTSLKSTLNSYHLLDEPIPLDTPDNYVTNVGLAVKSIQQGMLKKVVIARNTLWDTPSGFCPLTFFNRLCEVYPEAMVSLVSIKNIGTWVGATPELLLEVNNDNLSTVALAGTQLKNYAQWTNKESEEQLWVVRYIENILNEYGVNNIDISARKKITNGNLEHLYTQIVFNKAGTTNNSLASQILPQLHPTPAVGGLDKEKAIAFIKTHEKFNRSYYSGFLGEINKENISLFVNLRCMQLTNNGLVAYAGAGITKDSNPEKELQETDNKLNNLKSLLK